MTPVLRQASPSYIIAPPHCRSGHHWSDHGRDSDPPWPDKAKPGAQSHARCWQLASPSESIRITCIQQHNQFRNKFFKFTVNHDLPTKDVNLLFMKRPSVRRVELNLSKFCTSLVHIERIWGLDKKFAPAWCASKGSEVCINSSKVWIKNLRFLSCSCQLSWAGPRQERTIFKAHGSK